MQYVLAGSLAIMTHDVYWNCHPDDRAAADAAVQQHSCTKSPGDRLVLLITATATAPLRHALRTATVWTWLLRICPVQ
jgi:hypothetical protein